MPYVYLDFEWEFHFLPHTYAFVTLITPLSKILFRLRILEYLDPLFFGVYAFGKVWDDNRRPKISIWGWGMEQLDKKSLDIIVDDVLRTLQKKSWHIDETRMSYLIKTSKMLKSEKPMFIVSYVWCFYKKITKWGNMCHKCKIIG
jgi:hypothetical protein